MSQRYHSTNGRVILFKELYIGDCEDPQIYAGAALYDWEKSEHGNWVMNHCIEPPVWHVGTNMDYLGYVVSITGQLTEADEIIYRLKFDHLQRQR